jgi:hypothetical protein
MTSAFPRSYGRQTVGIRQSTVWRRCDIDALFRKGLRKQGILIWIGW